MVEAETLSFYKLKSHPDKLLITHLENVFRLIEFEINSKKLNLECEELDLKDKEFEKILQVIAISHDFAKSTQFFQKYLNKEINRSLKTDHSLLSSLFAFYLAKKLSINKTFLPFWVVKRHHGNLNDIDRESEDYISEFSDQLNKIDPLEIEAIYKELLSKTQIPIEFQKFKSEIYSECNLIYEIFDSTDHIKKNLKAFFLVQFLFSLLIDADKLDAGIDDTKTILEIKEKIKTFSLLNGVDNYLNKLDSTKSIDKIRQEIYNEAVNKAENIDLNNKILSINVPTGTGKTLTSLSFALKLKERLKNEKGFNPKIIYCLPFTSIIDQNYQVLQEVLKYNNIESHTNILLKHHHLSEISYEINSKDKDDEEFDSNKSLLLIESWMSSIVVTTFVQFFYSLISNKNKSLKKFHNIANSIVILDEIQSIPYSYWTLVNQTLKAFSKMFNTYFIIVTATQPLIFNENRGEIINVIENKEKYFTDNSLNRIILINETTPINLEELKLKLLEDLQDIYPDKSALIILNTIKSSQDIFTFLQSNLEGKDIEILYLSTTILPCDRLEIIQKVKDRKKSNKRVILVSTQVVEAGVDIDLDIVYRDLAPLDCIFQSAGRCNRNAIKDKGIVKVIKLLDSNNKNMPYSSYVYQKILLESTEAVLNTKNEFAETEFLQLSQQYYKLVNNSKSDDKSNDILNYMKKLEFGKISEFQLLEQKGLQACDFFIETNQDAMDIRAKFEDILKTENRLQRKYDLLEIKKEFYKYVVSIRLKKEQKQYFEGNSTYEIIKDCLYKIPNDELENFYRQNSIGFNLNSLTKLDSTGLII